MSRKHSHRGHVLGAKRRADRLLLRADHHGRRSARQFGVVVSLARMAELRATITSAKLPDGINRVGRVGLSADAYAVDLSGVVLVAVYDRQGQSIATFLPLGAPEITPEPTPIRHGVDRQDRPVQDARMAAVIPSPSISPAT